MEVLLYHREVQAGDFPDCCVRCGTGDTTLTPIVLTTSIPVLGGSFQYQEVELPFCPAHVRAPLISLNYPAARAFTEKGVIVKNVAPEFVDALEAHRAEERRQRRTAHDEPALPVLPAAPAKLSPERERAYRRFILGMIAVALLAGAAIGGIVLLVGRKGNDPAPAQRPQAPGQPNPPWGGGRGK